MLSAAVAWLAGFWAGALVSLDVAPRLGQDPVAATLTREELELDRPPCAPGAEQADAVLDSGEELRCSENRSVRARADISSARRGSVAAAQSAKTGA